MFVLEIGEVASEQAAFREGAVRGIVGVEALEDVLIPKVRLGAGGIPREEDFAVVEKEDLVEEREVAGVFGLDASADAERGVDIAGGKQAARLELFQRVDDSMLVRRSLASAMAESCPPSPNR